MAPMVLDQQQQQQQSQFVLPIQNGISLATLIDHLLQKTYHDLTVLSELLPRKPDIERKIEIIKFATKTRQQFIRLLALVKWAASEGRVDKFQAISSCLDEQNAFFINTADNLFTLSRNFLIGARLPNFSLPTAVDVLTTGTFKRLPKCIKTKIVPDDPIAASDKSKTLQHLNEVIQHRLVESKIPPEFNCLKINDGKLVLTVDHEFEAILMLMGDGSDVPWRLLHIEFLMEDYETGDGRSLVHGMQVHYIHQIVQSRLMVQDDPLTDLYNTLHNFCLSLQLEVLHTQSNRLIKERWGEFVRVEGYIPAEKLMLSFCRSPATIRSQALDKTPPAILISLSKEKKQSLVIKHVPPLPAMCERTVVNNGVYLSPDCLSIEKIFAAAVRSYSVSQLRSLLTTLSEDDYFNICTQLDETLPCLKVKPFAGCTSNEHVTISIDSRSGLMTLGIKTKSIKEAFIHQLQAFLHNDLQKFVEGFHKLRCMMFMEKSRCSVRLQPVILFDQFPIKNCNQQTLMKHPTTRLYLQFKRHSEYFIMLCVNIDKSKPSKPVVHEYYLLQVKENPDLSQNDSVNSSLNTDGFTESFQKVVCCFKLSTSAIMKEKKVDFKKMVDHVEKNKIKEEIIEDEQISLKKRKDKLAERWNKRRKRDGDVAIKEEHVLEERKKEEILNSVLSCVVRRSAQRIPFIDLSKQMMDAGFYFNGVSERTDEDQNLLVLDFPCPKGCKEEEVNSFREQILNSVMRFDVELSRWVMTYSFKKPDINSCVMIKHKGIVFEYDLTIKENEKKESYLADRILSDFKGLFLFYQHAMKVDSYLQAMKTCNSINTFTFKLYDMKSLTFQYSRTKGYEVKFSYNTIEKKYAINFYENGLTTDKCPHHITREHLQSEFNHHQNLHYILKVIHDTYTPLKAICKIVILPDLTISVKVLSVVNNFTLVAHSSTHIIIIYRNLFCLDVYLLESSVLIKDGTLYITDTTKAMRGFTSITQLTPFLQLFAEKYPGGGAGLDYPVTPGGMDLDQQNDHYSSSNDRYGIKSPAVVISSPQPYNQFAAPSPGNPPSVPSPGTFLQPSPAPISAMSPSTWPGSPPLVQGSPHPAKQGAGTQQSRMLSSINVSHAHAPVFLTHAGFKMLLAPVENANVKRKSHWLCPLEKFFGSIQLRSHLMRVLRIDDTLKHEKSENGIIIFSSSAGKNGPENGLQYSLCLNQSTMDYLVFRVTPSKGHEAAWPNEELSVLEQYFDAKVACAPYRVNVLTSFARILGAQPRILKDFIKVLRLEMQTNWTGCNFRVEVCLTIPPPIALTGTPAVAFKSKNLLFLQLTDVQNENNTFTITLVHEVKTNHLHSLEYTPLKNIPCEPSTWAVKARASASSFLNKIGDHIAQKDYPIYCAVYMLVNKFVVKE